MNRRVFFFHLLFVIVQRALGPKRTGLTSAGSASSCLVGISKNVECEMEPGTGI